MRPGKGIAMVFFRRTIGAASLLAFLSGIGHAAGISVRFLACPPEDSIVRYEIHRSDAANGSESILGEVPAVAGADTLDFQDKAAEKGKSYFYAVTGINADGIASDPSVRTQVGFPLLSLPDTLRPDKATGLMRVALPAASDPLRDSVPLDLHLEDSSRFSLAYDPAARTVSFRSRSDRADTGWVVVRAQYYGKFADRESVLVMSAAKTGSNGIAPAARAGLMDPAVRFLPAVYAPRSQGPLYLDRIPGPGNLELLTLKGSRAMAFRLPGSGSRPQWDGKDGNGAYLQPAHYLWIVRGPAGSVLQAGSILITP
jgi:hypothetical protein